MIHNNNNTLHIMASIQYHYNFFLGVKLQEWWTYSMLLAQTFSFTWGSIFTIFLYSLCLYKWNVSFVNWFLHWISHVYTKLNIDSHSQSYSCEWNFLMIEMKLNEDDKTIILTIKMKQKQNKCTAERKPLTNVYSTVYF